VVAGTKICMVTACYPPSRGGIEKSVNELTHYLLKKGHQIQIITSSRGLDPTNFYHEEQGNLEITRYPETRFFFDCPINPKIAAHVLRCNYDVLHVHGVTPTISDMAIVLGKIKRRPVVLTYHYSPVPDYGRRCGRFLSKLYMKIIDPVVVNLSDSAVVATKSFAKANSSLKNILKKIVIVPLGVDALIKGASLNEFDDETKINVLFVGQLKKYKGIRYLLKAIELLSEESFPLNLTIVGGGPERRSLETYARNLGVNANFTGILSDELIRSYYSDADIFVLPSISGREGFGLVILEAMSYGKLVIATDIPGPNEIVKNGYNGILVPPRDPAAIAKAIKKLASDSELRRTLSINARETAEGFSWEKVGERYEIIYNSIIHQG